MKAAKGEVTFAVDVSAVTGVVKSHNEYQCFGMDSTSYMYIYRTFISNTVEMSERGIRWYMYPKSTWHDPNESPFITTHHKQTKRVSGVGGITQQKTEQR